jgi:hypothetical protein
VFRRNRVLLGPSVDRRTFATGKGSEPARRIASLTGTPRAEDESRRRRVGQGKDRTEKEIQMATARLRVFPHPEEDETRDEPVGNGVPVRLVDLYPLLAQAYRDNFVWLRDFEEEQLVVSKDLYEVVRAFSNFRPSA